MYARSSIPAMSSHPSRSPSEEPARKMDPSEASTSHSQSPAGTTPGRVDDIEQDDNGRDDTGQGDNGKDDPPQTDHEDQENATDKTNVSAPADDPTNIHVTPSQGDWQAIWAPAQNAYYFYNARTNETTWTNPLQPQPPTTAAEESESGTSHPTTSTSSTIYAAQAAAEAAGIDPSLAYLDPSLGLPGSTPAGTFTAKFNARTGAFARVDARDPSHLSESERAKRMSQVYFDVGAWEKEVEVRKEEEAAAEANGKKRKRPTKKDLERFKEQKKQKKIAKTAWLRT